MLVDRRIFIFGGREGPSYYNSFYIPDTISRKWTHINPPEPLPLPQRTHTIVLYQNKLYILGDGNDVKALNYVWSLDMSVPVERELLKTHGERPGPRRYRTANLVGNVVIVIGEATAPIVLAIFGSESRYVHAFLPHPSSCLFPGGVPTCILGNRYPHLDAGRDGKRIQAALAYLDASRELPVHHGRTR
jgi:Kelch motif